ncbi:ribosomal protection-like ABC-F family protein [Paenibacillus sp. KN14-4R]|uniref:ribosomal protection-like ABC-F family protein n=1 Tax=Paenibacillus sp. KN14-4R TaxID=3445773 RepID=UPI003FA146F7
MLFLKTSKLTKMVGDRVLFETEPLHIYKQDRIGIVGMNGAGKTTLLQVMSGQQEPDQGAVTHLGIPVVIQQLEVSSQEELDAKQARKFKTAVQYERTMSGGEQMRLKMAQAFADPSDILFADEPTSNLDVDGIRLLEDELNRYVGAIVLISHDRTLLDRICTSIWEVENGKVTIYEGNYTAYLMQKEAVKAKHQADYDAYTAEKLRLTTAIHMKTEQSSRMTKAPSRMSTSESRLYKGKKGSKQANVHKATKQLETRLEQLTAVEQPRELATVKIDIPESSKLYSKMVIRADQLTIRVGSRTLLQDAKFEICNGQKTVLIGPNGSGKTTLLEMIHSRRDEIFVASGVKFGYFSQSLDILDPERSIFDNVNKQAAQSEHMVRTVLSRLLFTRDDVYKKVKVLSGGERVRVAFAKVFLSEMNVLLMDEPTNYLDVKSLDAFEQLLRVYEGTLIFVSHDRHFVNQIATNTLKIEDQKLIAYGGNPAQLEQHMGDRTHKAPQSDEIEIRKLQLETRLTEVISRLSIPSVKSNNNAELDAEYLRLVMELKQLRFQTS